MVGNQPLKEQPNRTRGLESMTYDLHYLFLLSCIYFLNSVCHVHSFTFTMALTGTKAKSTASFVSNRIFVSGLRPSCEEDELKSAFAKFGHVESVEIVNYQNQKKKVDKDNISKKRKRGPFAFVTFKSGEIAQDVISKHESILRNTTDGADNDTGTDNSTSSPLYTIVKPAKAKVPRQAKCVKKTKSDQEKVYNMCQGQDGPSPNLIIQVHTSHLDRMIKYVVDLQKVVDEHSDAMPTYIGSSPAKARNISLLFLFANDRIYWHDFFLANIALTRFGINKIYGVDQLVRVPPSQQEDEKKADLFVNTALDQIIQDLENVSSSPSRIFNQDNIILKAQTFPTKQNLLRHKIVASLDRLIGDIQCNTDKSFRFSKLREKNLSISSNKYTHTLSCIQVCNRSTHMRSTGTVTVDEIFMIGILPITPYEKKSLENANNEEADESEDQGVCRAYFKLDEVFANYRRDEKDVNMSFKGKDAFDCGSSPGGWTKYLLINEKCNVVYSCDPGKLDETVKSMEGTRYLQMRGEDAINMLQREGKTVGLWVSDMCLADPKHQVDHLVMAKERGILEDNAFFILTLKFNTGHASDTFDLFAREELARLKEKMHVENIQIYHLFSNRKGERTLIGRLS